MKTNRLLSVALALVTLTLFSCTRAEQDVAPSVKSCPEVRTFTCKIGPGGEDTRISIDGEGITRWKAGDRILVHGEYIGEVDGKQYSTVVTLTEGDISADGKTATISVTTDPAGLAGIVPYVHSKSGVQDYSSTLYAAYPAEAVTEGPLHSYYHTVFAETNHPLMIAYDDHADGDVFVFTQAGSVLSFTLPSSLDYTSYVFYGNDEEEVGYGRWTAKTARKTTGEISNYFPYTGGDVANPVSLPQIEISGPVVCDGQTLNRICLPGKKVSFPHGFTIAFLRGEERVMQVAVKSSVEMNRGEYLPLGDVSGHLKPYVHKSSIPKKDAVDLGENGTANCYIVEPGSASGAIYKFPAVKGNSTAAVSGIERVDLLWETWNNAEAVQPHSVVAQADFEDGYIYFRMPVIPDGGSRRSGNAVIAAKDGDGAVLWSWHIWVPETAIETGTSSLLDKGLMDRNLGALVAASTTAAASVESFGLLYQWGRKDPFTGAGAVGSGDGATVAGQAATVATGTISLSQSIQNPTLLGHTNNGDWLDTADNTLWSDDTKTLYDPCPAGYRVPARDQAQPMWSSDLSAVSGWGTNVSQYWFKMGSPAVVFPLSGYRDDYEVGSLSHAGDRAVLWSASNSGDAKGSALHVRPSVATFTNGLGTAAKSRAASVRCVTESAATVPSSLPEMVSHERFKLEDGSDFLPELSGLCLSQSGDFLWGVGDKGRLYKVFFDGTYEVHWDKYAEDGNLSTDMEGLCMDPATGTMYMAIEPKRVYKLNSPYTSKSTLYDVAPAANMGNSGIEGIAWHNGNLYLGSQEGAMLWEYDLSGNMLSEKSLRDAAPTLSEIAGLDYDEVNDWLWVVDSNGPDEDHPEYLPYTIYLFNGDGTELLKTYDISGFASWNPESICVDHANGCIWVGEDCDSTYPSRLHKITFTGLGSPAYGPSQTLCEDAYLGIRPMVMAYVTEYTKKSTLSAEYLTHINYCHGRFVNPETGDGGITIVSDNISIEDVVALKSAKPGLKVLLMIGGWGGKADGFSEMARDPDKRTEFCQSCKAHVDHYGLDGIDIDWEYPTVSADNETGASPEDTQNFNLVLRELRQTLGTKKIISVASSSNASYIDWSFARDYVDYVNVMSYDMGNPPYHNSTLYRSSLTKSLSCEESVEKHRIAGMPLKRQNLGVPFYGHGKSPYKSDVKYNEMASILGATSGTYAGYNVYHWDDVAKVPYLTDASGNIYLCYDNPESVAWKGRFAREKDMMGVMVWEYRHDDAEFSMLKALYNAVYPE